MSSDELNNTAAQEPANAPGRAEMPVEGRAGADAVQGTSASLSWGARSDVGLVRGHNEDSFLIQAPLFAVCDGMGGHAAGEVASAIAVRTIAEKAPAGADDVLLGAAVEAANTAVIQGAEDGVGKPGMGCTASCCLLEEGKMSVAHVGDSRIYLLRRGTIVRVTHDHSYVEELVDSGQITADEARTHPSRSIITRALGSDPDMYADHFSLEVSNGDRVILCSDGLSSMIPDSEIEALAVSSATPQQAADNLVAAALTAGGLDNVTVVVVDVVDDGSAEKNRRRLAKRAGFVGALLVALLVVTTAVCLAFVRGVVPLGQRRHRRDLPRRERERPRHPARQPRRDERDLRQRPPGLRPGPARAGHPRDERAGGPRYPRRLPRPDRREQDRRGQRGRRGEVRGQPRRAGRRQRLPFRDSERGRIACAAGIGP